jgi:hypothetical protein
MAQARGIESFSSVENISSSGGTFTSLLVSSNTTVSGRIYHSGGITGEASVNQIVCSDSESVLQLSSTASPNATNGPYIDMRGNDFSSGGGNMYVIGSSAAGKAIYINASASNNGGIYFQTAGATRWSVAQAGHLVPSADNSYHIGSLSSNVSNIYTHVVNIHDLGWQTYKGSATTNDWTVGTQNPNFLLWNVADPSNTKSFYIQNGSGGGVNYIANGVTLNAPFTGTLIYDKEEATVLEEGDAVKLVNRKLVKCTEAQDKACIGIYTSEVVSTDTISGSPMLKMRDSFGQEYIRDEDPIILYTVATCGDSKTNYLTGAKLCNEGGDIEDGDLLCTASGHPGHLKKQSDEILKAYTVAQAREEVTFSGSPTVSGAYVYLLK